MASEHDSEPRDIGAEVRAFYESLPFNFHGTVGASVASVRDNPIASSYPDLHDLLASGRVEQVLEIGCGAGWLCNALALHYAVEVTAVDFCAKALLRARAVAQSLGTVARIRFIASDLFDYQHDGQVDLVISLGVLHHTRSAEAAFHHIQRFARPGGCVYVGLYHAPGRRVFLDMFHSIVASRGEEAAFACYRGINSVRTDDETQLRSWFRDQVQHPYETHHTLREISDWLARDRLSLQSTSINEFGPIASVALLFEQEVAFSERSRRANLEERRFFPGFFTFLARR